MHHHHLVEYKPPHREHVSVTDLVCIGRDIDPRHQLPNGRGRICPIKLKQGQRAIVLRISLLYTHSDATSSTTIKIAPFFSEEGGVEGHPDHAGGACLFTIPAGRRGAIPKADQLIYEPNLVNTPIPVLQYAGLEHLIACTEVVSTSLIDIPRPADYQVFPYSDPFVVFLVKHSHLFDKFEASDVMMIDLGTKPIYKVRTQLVERVKQFFRNSIFPLLHYTTEPYLTFECPSMKDMHGVIMFQLELSYVIIDQGAVFDVIEFKL